MSLAVTEQELDELVRTYSEHVPINGTTRRATPYEKELCRLKLSQGKPVPEDTSEWEMREIWVIEHNGIISGCVGARQVWQVEPLYLFPEFVRDAPPITLRRAVFRLARAIETWLRGQGAHWYLGYIEKKPMQRMAREYGMIPVYRKGKVFGKDL
jgi:hypothetical protein